MRLVAVLPPTVEFNSVAQAVAACHGAAHYQAASVHGNVTLCEWGSGGYRYSYSFEGPEGSRQITLLATDVNLCVAKRLVHRFGGVGFLEHEGRLHTFRKQPIKKLRPITAITRKDLAEARRIIKKLYA